MFPSTVGLMIYMMKYLKVMSVNMCYIDSLICVLNMVSPVPKSSMKDLYRGVSLLSNVSKIYSQVLNNCIVSYCKITDLFFDEQNGYR